MATSCQPCNTLGLIPTAPPYAGPPPAPPVQGCAAVWGEITGSVANQTDLAAYIREVAQKTTKILGADVEVLVNEPKTVIQPFTTSLAANSIYEITLNLQTGLGASEASGLLFVDLVLPAGAQFSGTWTGATENGTHYSSIEGGTTAGFIRTSVMDSVNIVTNTSSTFLLRTLTAGNVSVRTFTDAGEMSDFFIYAGSWMNLTKLE